MLLEAERISKLYPVRHGRRGSRLHAVDGISLAIGEGESVGLVGESGCGKSTLARLVARLTTPTGGRLAFAGTDIGAIPEHRFARSPERAAIQIVFQDPNESLNPAFTVLAAVMDPIRRLLPATSAARAEELAFEALDDVGLPRALAHRYPHQLSGGQKARVGIARAIVVRPKLLILDEPTSALDVSVQSVILKLLGDLKDRLGMSYLFVSHDLNVVRLICDRIVVMYLGKVVESGPADAVFRNPQHPYTKALIAAIPDPARRGEKIQRLEGTASSPIDPDPNACRFAGRCPVEVPLCTRKMPELLPAGEAHLAACHLIVTPGIAS
ncbi:Oligopeptide transport ATP-binding protein OppF [Hartmannibacter diazotrophicus]|uniref:Oligopeptide transport ATP-binding protein OppF n=1 Tax=Hartmannibacter diazotrophicus TaxID=1482074 RepID=A0A2C9D428_9HYPH|nr:Oligopeptide transport ATP-binding protein OppF [Hartmannibacter diazotrophicus]